MTPAELRALRAGLGLTQLGLARRVGVAANTVARWERGELAVHPLRLPRLRRMARDLARRNSAIANDLRHIVRALIEP
jgi:transcriptional regulator with XRE-family HTH domain